jgi:hypothetical protein
MSFNNNIIFNRLLNDIGINVQKQNTKSEKYNINKLNISEKIIEINNKNILYYLFIFIFIFLFFNRIKITINHIFSLIIFVIILNYLLNHNLNDQQNYYNKKNKQINFLNKYLFNNQKELNYNLDNKLYSKKYLSYFYIDPILVDFLYSIKELVNYNSQNYGQVLLNCNNILTIRNDTKLGLENIEQNYQNANFEKKKALNSLESIIISLPMNNIFDKKLENAVSILQEILDKHLNYILKFIKIKQLDKNYSINDIPLDLLKSDSLINPHNTKDDYHEYFNT